MSIIEVNNLSKSFDFYKKELGLKNSVKNLFHREKLSKEAVKGISFQIEKGEIVGFLGPNGAGKTTTLKMLSGILFPTSGSASVLGFTPWERKKEFKKNFSIVMGQKNQLWWDLPANESFYINKCIYEVEDDSYKNMVGYLSEMLGVKHLLNVQVRRLSLGERMKMELIASLIHKPQILFLDEPTIGLDFISQKAIQQFLADFNEKLKTTIILTSHYMNDIENLCKRAIVINQGKVVYDGELSNVNGLLNQKKIVKLQLEEPVELYILEKYGTVKKRDQLSAVVEVEKKDVRRISMLMLEDLPILDLTIEDIPIEEGIEVLYKENREEVK
jgi:ABC-2 type transport system ATP-binding protein